MPGPQGAHVVLDSANVPAAHCVHTGAAPESHDQLLSAGLLARVPGVPVEPAAHEKA